MPSTRRITAKLVGRPADFKGSDGKVYNGRIAKVTRQRFVRFDYYVWPIGEVSAYLDMRQDAHRIVEIY